MGGEDGPLIKPGGVPAAEYDAVQVIWCPSSGWGASV